MNNFIVILINILIVIVNMFLKYVHRYIIFKFEDTGGGAKSGKTGTLGNKLEN